VCSVKHRKQLSGGLSRDRTNNLIWQVTDASSGSQRNSETTDPEDGSVCIISDLSITHV
jgi:hypothetical protein